MFLSADKITLHFDTCTVLNRFLKLQLQSEYSGEFPVLTALIIFIIKFSLRGYSSC